MGTFFRVASTLGIALCLLTVLSGDCLAQSGTGVITGRVVGKESGEPVPRGWVIANSIEASANVEQGLGGSIQNDGSFHIYNVPLGSYLLTARAPGYANSDQSGESTSRRVVEVGTPQNTAVTLVLRRMGVLSGTVLDEDGFPVEGANVTAYPVTKDGRRTRRNSGGSSSATTDDQGHYRISGIAAGAYLVRALRTGANYLASVQDHSSQDGSRSLGARVEHAYHPNAATPDGASVATVGPGEDRFGVDITYPDVPGFSITGIVLNSDGSPLPRAPVMVLQGNRRHPFAIRSAHAVSGEDGRFRTGPLPPGSYLLEVNTRSARDQGDRLVAYASTELSGGPGNDVLLQLRIPPQARGELSMPRQSALPPGTAARVPLRPKIALLPDEATADNTAGFTRIGMANFSGPNTFTIGPLRPGAWRLEVDTPYPGWYVAEATLGGQNLLAGAATVGSGADEIPLTIVLKEGASTLRGTVPVREGSGTHACFLRLYPIADREGSSPHVKQVYCDEQGSFTATGVAPGRYKAFLFTMEEMEESDMEALAAERWDRAATITFNEREEKEVQLEWP